MFTLRYMYVYTYVQEDLFEFRKGGRTRNEIGMSAIISGRAFTLTEESCI